MRFIPESKIREAIRLRVDEQISAPTIARRVGISNSSAYKILRPYPWTGTVRHDNDWTPAEIEAVVQLWPTATHKAIVAALPRRSWLAISQRATGLGLRRPSARYRLDANKAHPTIAKLERIRRADGVPRRIISKKIKAHTNVLMKWAIGRSMPRFDKVDAWARAMGYELVLRKIKG